MYIYPIGICAENLDCKKNENSFNGLKKRVLGKRIKVIGNEFVKKSRNARNRDEIYFVATSYLKNGILPVLDSNNSKAVNLYRQKIVDMYASEIELNFAPEVIQIQEQLKNISLKGQQKKFKGIVDAINKIIKHDK